MEPVGQETPGLAAGDGPLVTSTREIPAVALRAFLRAYDAPRVVWAAPDEPTVAGCGAVATLSAEDGGRFDAVRAGAESLFSRLETPPGPEEARPRLFGGFAFHDDHDASDPWAGFPGAYFVLPRVQVTRDGDRTWLTVNGVADGEDDPPAEAADRIAAELAALPAPGPNDGPPGVTERRPTTPRATWREQVRAAVDRIEGGDLTKAVLAQALEVDLGARLSVPDALARLRTTYPDCFRFLVQPPGVGDGVDAGFFGATPERLVSLDGRDVETTALAGSTGRGDTAAEDDWLAAELLESEKDIHEHELVVDAVREQLAPYAASVRTGQRTIRKLDSVQHLETPVSAELDDVEHVLTLVEALHPTPAVGGLPPDAAWETIRAAETFDRGWYAAPVGWFDPAGNGTFAVGIRSAVADGDRATLFAGAGIVGDSDPDREWDEVQLKYRPMLGTLE